MSFQDFLPSWLMPTQPPGGTPAETTGIPAGAPVGGIGEMLSQAMVSNRDMLGLTGLGLLSARTAEQQRQALMNGYVFGMKSDRDRRKDEREEAEKKQREALARAATDALKGKYANDPTMAALAAAYPKEIAEGYIKAQAGPTPTDEIREYQFDRNQWAADPNNAGKAFPTFGDWKTNLRKAGATRVNVNTAENKFESAYGEGLGKDALGVVEGGRRASSNLGEIGRLEKILEGASTGKLAQAGMTVGAYGRSVGISDENLKRMGLDPNVLINREAALGLINRQIIGQLGSGAFPTNNFSNADREFLEKTLPSLGDQPEANAIKLEALKRANIRSRDMADAWQQAREGGTSYEKFLKAWAEKTAREPVFGDLAERSAAVSGGYGPAPTRNPGGAVPPARIRVDPQGRMIP
jgi:hypothetical protein